MNPSVIPVQIREIPLVLLKRLRLWTVPTAAGLLFGIVYALMQSPQWSATQAMVVRDEVTTGSDAKGRFESIDAMKNAQETILELAHKRNVVQAALKEAGPPSSWRMYWPTNSDIERVRQSISITPPNGNEFGHTEVINLNVNGPTPERAVALTAAVGNQLEARMKQLRVEKAGSLMRELERTLQVSRAELNASTARLETVEGNVGSDLGELRILNDVGAGESNLRQTLTQLRNELRAANVSLQTTRGQQRLVEAAMKNPDTLIATPNHLLEKQAALRRLKEGVIDAQLRKAELVGKMNEQHPVVLAAVRAEEEVRRNLYGELKVASRGLSAEAGLQQDQVNTLQGQLAEIQKRLDALARLRARYGNLVAEVEQHARVVETIQKDLSKARASQAAARASSLLTRLDSPEASDSPVGPGRTMIVAGCTMGGLMLGLGMVFLAAPLKRLRGRRRSDLVAGAGDATRVGRRSSEKDGKRMGGPGLRGTGGRAEDHPARGQRAADHLAPQRREYERQAPGANPWETATPATSATAQPAPVPVQAASTEGAPQRRGADRRGGDRRSGARRE